MWAFLLVESELTQKFPQRSRQLNHVHFIHAKNGFHLFVIDDVRLVRWTLQFVFLDISPQFFCDLGASVRDVTHNGTKLFAWLEEFCGS